MVGEVCDELHREIRKLALLNDLRIYEGANAIIEEFLKDEDDVKAILKFTRVDMDLLERRARENNALSILEEIIVDKPS